MMIAYTAIIVAVANTTRYSIIFLSGVIFTPNDIPLAAAWLSLCLSSAADATSRSTIQGAESTPK